MAVIPLPTFARFPEVDFTPMFRNQANVSIWTGARKVMGLPGGERFAFNAVSRPVYTETQARAWRAFVMLLRGRENHFLLPLTRKQQYLGTNPSVSSAVQGATSAALIGIPTGGIKAGSWLTFTITGGLRQAVIITADAPAGSATVQFQMPLRKAATGAVEIRLPVAEIALTEDLSGWSDKNGGFQLSFTGEEAFPGE